MFIKFYFILFNLFMSLSMVWVICAIFKSSVELCKLAIFNSQRVLTFMKAVSSFDRHAELFYSALDLISDEEEKAKLKTAWEDLLCQK